jgi:hypothetical protein
MNRLFVSSTLFSIGLILGGCLAVIVDAVAR